MGMEKLLTEILGDEVLSSTVINTDQMPPHRNSTDGAGMPKGLVTGTTEALATSATSTAAVVAAAVPVIVPVAVVSVAVAGFSRLFD
ncbi:MAG: hypothetical protein GXZ05_01975 [Gammaproteobacteria bacterium]|nr:hypothetical protein [Gammaproteobacteria bacterium]